MSDTDMALRAIIASALDWQEAHATFDAAVAGIPDDLRGRRPASFPHSAWELVEHIRITQEDLADFMESADYPVITWPDEYWPSTPAPASAAQWDRSIETVRRDRDRIKAVAMNQSVDLTAKIPWGTGQTWLRTILVAIDHTAYHVGQIIAVRKLLGAWPS